MLSDGRPDWGGRYAADITRTVLDLMGTVCVLCGLDGATTADHDIPRSLGGPDTLDNLAPAHRACNSAKGTKTRAEWFSQRPLTYRTQTAPSREW